MYNTCVMSSRHLRIVPPWSRTLGSLNRRVSCARRAAPGEPRVERRAAADLNADVEARAAADSAKSAEEKAKVERYVAYVKEQYEAIIAQMEGEHDRQVAELKLAVQRGKDDLSSANSRALGETVMLKKSVAMMKEELDKKDVEKTNVLRDREADAREHARLAREADALRGRRGG